MGMAPFIRLTVEGQEAGKPALVAEDGMLGLLPHFAAERKYGRRTYNAIGALLTVRRVQFLQDQRRMGANDFPRCRPTAANSPAAGDRSQAHWGYPSAMNHSPTPSPPRIPALWRVRS